METLWSQRAWQEKTATRTLGKEGSYEAIAEVCIKMCGSRRADSALQRVGLLKCIWSDYLVNLYFFSAPVMFRVMRKRK